MWPGRSLPKFRTKVLPPSSGVKIMPSQPLKLGLRFDTEGGGRTSFPVNSDQTKRHHIPEDSNLHTHHCENLKPNKFIIVSRWTLVILSSGTTNISAESGASIFRVDGRRKANVETAGPAE